MLFNSAQERETGHSVFKTKKGILVTSLLSKFEIVFHESRGINLYLSFCL